jgi:hypothetical protein
MKPFSGLEEEEPQVLSSWSSWLMAGGVTMLAIAAGSLLAARVLHRKDQAAPTPARSVHQTALQELKQIEALNLPASGEFERFHVELSNLIRRYVERRFPVQATQQTSPEFLERVQAAAWLTSEQQALLRDFLEQCDLVKFAGVTPPAEQCEALVGAARRFIDQTAAG